jgi:hypothetical protein
MTRRFARVAAVAGVALGLTAAVVPAWAGRVAQGRDPGFELTRIVSQYQGGTSEAISPGETIPTMPIQGETILFGQSNVFPEGVQITTFRPGEGTRRLRSGVDFFFKATVVTPDNVPGAFTTVAIHFPAAKVALIQNAQVDITIQPQPGPGPTGDVIERVLLRGPRS